jgi:methionyl-tRNA formyltransferase
MNDILNILYIGYESSKIKDFLSKTEILSFIDGSAYISLNLIKTYSPDLIILHGCHSILSEDIVKAYPNKIINCHGAYLPYNRGRHPNVWSVLENTPGGGTIHLIDENIDKGTIIYRKQLEIYFEDTLASTYWRIRDLLEDMFIEIWPQIKNNSWEPIEINWNEGTLHYGKDLKKVEHLLINGWETKIKDLKNNL